MTYRAGHVWSTQRPKTAVLTFSSPLFIATALPSITMVKRRMPRVYLVRHGELSAKRLVLANRGAVLRPGHHVDVGRRDRVVVERQTCE